LIKLELLPNNPRQQPLKVQSGGNPLTKVSGARRLDEDL